jgi:hypothetical protein
MDLDDEDDDLEDYEEDEALIKDDKNELEADLEAIRHIEKFAAGINALGISSKDVHNNR